MLLNDNEAEVKNAAISSLAQCFKTTSNLDPRNLSTEKICSLLLPTLQNAYTDATAQFKAGIAVALCEMAPIIGKDYSGMKVMPILMELIKDDNADVRLNVATGMIKIGNVLGPELLSTQFLTTVGSMTKDAQWRVRMAVFELIGDLARLYGKDVFQKQLESIFMTYLTNTAASVREMGVNKARELAEKFKGDWVVQNFLPKVIENYGIEKQGYNYRMCSLNSCSAVCPFITKDQITQHIAPLLVKAMKDPIPNVRFGAAKIVIKNK